MVANWWQTVYNDKERSKIRDFKGIIGVIWYTYYVYQVTPYEL